MYGIFQGDRLIVANRLGATELGLFSLAFVLTLVPAKVMAQTQTALFLPGLSRCRTSPTRLRPARPSRSRRVSSPGIVLATGFAVLGPDIVLVLFGDKYSGALTLLIWLAVMQAVRIAKLGISAVALARGETQSPMLANILRVLLLPAAWIAVGRGRTWSSWSGSPFWARFWVWSCLLPA